jgi:hypothetical protein
MLGSRLFQVGCLVLSVSAVPCAHAAADLERVESLVQGGAPRLALSVIEREQPPPSDPAWAVWERVRFATYHTLQDWAALSRRVEKLPADVAPEFRRYAMLQAADAYTRQNNARAARRVLRQLLWVEPLEPAQAAQARRLVIRSYLAEDNLDDALTALARYREELGAGSEAWKLLHAEIALRAGRDKEAFDALAGLQSFDARLLRLKAGLHADLYRPARVVKDARALAGELKTRAPQARQAWGLTAQAAGRVRDRRTRIEALENALAISEPALPQPLFTVTADELWAAYDDLAEFEGNQARLLIGDDQAWLARARKYPCAERLTARAFYAFLARAAHDPAVREEGHDWLAYTLFVDGKPHVAQALYTRSAHFSTLDAIPATVRYRLADKALAEYNVKLAAELVRDLDQPPQDEDAELWTLRRARMLIYADEIGPGVNLLKNQVGAREQMSADMADRYLQVLFDLQALNQHAQAAELLERLYALVDAPALQREILYWQADSQTALGRHQEAAELYLRSATFGGSKGLDPWGETARFRAADELGKAGLVDDARSIYSTLLRQATDPRRRVQIERQMQQLWLVRNKAAMP